MNEKYILSVIRKNPGISISELSRNLKINRMTISRSVAVLEARLEIVIVVKGKHKGLFPGLLKALTNKRGKD